MNTGGVLKGRCWLLCASHFRNGEDAAEITMKSSSGLPRRIESFKASLPPRRKI